MLKNIAAAAAAVFLFFSAAHTAEPDDPLQITSLSFASRSTISATAQKRRCVGVFEDHRLSFVGSCFGIPGELSSDFVFDDDGRLVRSSITLGDAVYLSELWRSLRQLCGRPEELRPAQSGLSWTVGREVWTFMPAGRVRWTFSREPLSEKTEKKAAPF